MLAALLFPSTLSAINAGQPPPAFLLAHLNQQPLQSQPATSWGGGGAEGRHLPPSTSGRGLGLRRSAWKPGPMPGTEALSVGSPEELGAFPKFHRPVARRRRRRRQLSRQRQASIFGATVTSCHSSRQQRPLRRPAAPDVPARRGSPCTGSFLPSAAPARPPPRPPPPRRLPLPPPALPFVLGGQSSASGAAQYPGAGRRPLPPG